MNGSVPELSEEATKTEFTLMSNLTFFQGYGYVYGVFLECDFFFEEESSERKFETCFEKNSVNQPEYVKILNNISNNELNLDDRKGR